MPYKATLYIPSLLPQPLLPQVINYLRIQQVAGLCAESIYRVANIMGIEYAQADLLSNSLTYAVYTSFDHSSGRNPAAEVACARLVKEDVFGESEDSSDVGYLYGPVLVIEEYA